ncbi:ABC transporter substrate-binding protein [Amycolatopsis rhizosphaerae]|uniref:ABC transporter substrate-binding protein n=1 Tax=Amycolatopsis rhizosphaerae TaxID=2053003 RepID=UPI001643AFAA|nr:ABC transporter substrate-binding protein [Amycolatopsis rhizosphaerae]
MPGLKGWCGGTRGRLSVPSRRPVAAATAIALIVALAGCASAGDDRSRQPKPSGRVGETLTIAYASVPQTLDPAKAVQNNSLYQALAYEPLIVRRSDGGLAPGLATSWKYDGNDNTRLELRLRDGVTFSDGSPLTAQGVVDHFGYVVKQGGQFAPMFADATFSASGPLTVVITTAKPNPDLPTLLTQDDVVGGVISPAGLRDTAKLGTQTFGAGPYQLDPAQTVAGDHYTFVQNPNYYDKAAVHWKRVVVRAITNPEATLNAMKTGQADFAVGDASTVSAARQAGLTVTSTPLLWTGVTLADRGGTMAKPLADVRVRQALNYATDRQAIASALFPDGGRATSQLTVPGGYGYDSALDNAYPYQPDKAKDLLAQAGYPNGFPLPIVTADYQSMNLVAQALAQQWQKIGVTLQITDRANSNQYTSEAFAPNYPSFMTIFGQQPIWTEGPSLFLPSALFNPFHVADPQLQALFDESAKATGDAKDSADRQVETWLVRQAWFVPVVATGLPFYATKKVTGTSVSPRAPLVSVYEIQPAA